MRFSKLHNLVLFSTLASAVVAPAAFAQVSDLDRLPGVIDRGVPDVDLEIKKPDDPITAEPQPELPADAAEPVASFDRVEFSGLTVIDNEILQEIAAPYLGRVINKGELAELKFKVTQEFYKAGYILVKVVTPPQNLTGKTLTIQIYEAEIGSINVIDPDNVLNDHVSDQFTARVGEGDVFYEQSAESMVSDLNELKNLSASLNLRPGEKFKTTDLDVYINEAEEDVNYVTADNYGSELTGRRVYAIHLEKSNLLGLGETLRADARRSEDNLSSLDLGITTPIGFRNILLEARALRSDNDIGGRLFGLQASGQTEVASLALSSNIINTRDRKINVRVGLEGRNHESFLGSFLDTKDDIRQAFVEGSFLERVDGGVFYASTRVSQGLDAFGASGEGDPRNTRSRGNPQALTFEPLILVNFRPDLIPGVPFINGEVRAIATGQLSNDTLLSSDLFVVGGYGSVRGFPVAAETGEAGYQFSVEYNHYIDLVEDWIFKAGPFVDGATVWNRLDGQTVDDHIYSTGLGFEASTEEIVDVGTTRLRVDVAHPIGAYTSQQVDDNVVYFSLTQNF